MRETIHLVSRRDYALLAAGIRTSGQEWWRRVNKIGPEVDMRAFARRARVSSRRGTQPDGDRGVPARERLPRASIWGFSHWLDLVRVPPAGTWEQRRAHTFALAEEWVGPLAASEEAGIELLARRYLGGFGPASKHDLASWCKVPLAKLDPVLERNRLRRFRDEQGKELLDLPRAPLPDPETPAPVRFLPTWDGPPVRERTGILPRSTGRMCSPREDPTLGGDLLVDGAVAGTAVRPREGDDERVPRLDPGTRREVREEAERLADLHA